MSNPPRHLSIHTQTERYLLELRSHGLADATIRTYRYHLAWFAEWLAAAGVTLDQVTRSTCEDWLVNLEQQGLEPKTRRDSRSALRCFFAWLVDRGERKDSPFAGIRSIKVPRKLPHFLQVGDVLRILGAARTPRERTIAELLYGSGLRRAELVGLELDDVYLDACEVLVRGKGGIERLQPISAQARDAIRDWIPERLALLEKGKGGRAYSARAVFGETRALLVTREGPMSWSTLYDQVKAIAERAGVDRNVYPHLFRHSFATHLLNNGAGLRQVQELLGHSQLATTQIYTHVAIEEKRRTYLACHPRAREDQGLPPSATPAPAKPRSEKKALFRLLGGTS